MLNGEHDNCWICDKWVYSLVFYNPGSKDTNLFSQNSEVRNYMIKQLTLFNENVSVEHESEAVQSSSHYSDKSEFDDGDIESEFEKSRTPDKGPSFKK
jgi:hypothetical protein